MPRQNYRKRRAGEKAQRWRKARREELWRESPFCCYCGKMVHLHHPELMRQSRAHRNGSATLEHFKPQREGGRDTRQNTGLACWPCNQKKGHSHWLTLDELLS